MSSNINFKLGANDILIITLDICLNRVKDPDLVVHLTGKCISASRAWCFMHTQFCFYYVNCDFPMKP